MLIDVKVPVVGESISEGFLAEWLKADGDAVRRDEPLFVLETDKVTLQVVAEQAGKLKVIAGVGETVKIGQVVATLDTDAAPAQVPGPPVVAPAGFPQAREKMAAAAAHPLPPPGEGASDLGLDDLAPAVRRIVEEFHLTPTSIPSTGKGGRLTKEDVVKFVQGGGGEAEGGPRAPAGSITSEGPGIGDRGPGAGGPDDRPSPIASSPHHPIAPPADARASSQQAATPAPGRQTRTPMSPLRQRIAERLVMAQHTAAVLSTFNEADLSGVLALRQRHGEAFKAKHGVALGFMSFFVKAAVEGLKAVPALNAHIQGNEIVQNHYYDIGVAVSSDRGLSVPVIRDCDRLSLAGMERAIGTAALRVRERLITLEELVGGVFTVSNAGVFGGLLGTPILNPPQSGILGVYAMKRRPVAVGDRVEIRPMAYLALSYDHRLVDGKEAAQFLVRVADCLEHPGFPLLEV